MFDVAEVGNLVDFIGTSSSSKVRIVQKLMWKLFLYYYLTSYFGKYVYEVLGEYFS